MIDTILEGDCLELLPTLPEDSIDAIVTDPPYELTSGNSKKGFMGKAWDGSGIAYNVGMWAECLRVLKPGGHMLAFGGDRTHHRMFCAIEDAGFEIRHTVVWTYGSGFPKSLDISKALDKMAGAEREVIGIDRSAIRANSEINHKSGQSGNFGLKAEGTGLITAPATPAAKQWAGWGSALKPAAEFICLARKPLAESTIAANVLRWGCGGLNIDGCRVEMNGETWDKNIGSPILGKNITGNSLCLSKDECFREIEKQSSPLGRFPANLIWSHSPNCKRIGTKKVKPQEGHRPNPVGKQSDGNIQFNQKEVGFQKVSYTGADGLEEVESWDCDPSCPSWQFAKAGERKSGGSLHERSLAPGMIPFNGSPISKRNSQMCASTGSAARFFQACPFTEDDIPAFLYHAKASKSDRGEGNTHCTTKPSSLIRYLCRLICPLGGTILDPFGGSGTLAVAAIRENFHYILIEKEREYIDICRSRVEAELKRIGPKQSDLSASLISNKIPS